MKYANLRPFGMDNDSIDINTYDTLLAKRVKYVYQFYYERDLQPIVMPSEDVLNELWYKGRNVTHHWADIYNADAIPTKLRSIGYSQKDWATMDELIQEQIDILSEVEHNRWNVDRLLIGFRPPTKEEDAVITASKGKEKSNFKDRYIHYDIRPYDDLRIDHTGRNANEYDVCLTKALPLIVKE